MDVSMADLISCWKSNTGQDVASLSVSREEMMEFLSYSQENLDMMLEQIQSRKNTDHDE